MASSLGLDVVGAVLVPHQVAGCLLVPRRGRRPAEADLGPPERRDAASLADQVVHGVERDQRDRPRTPGPPGHRRCGPGRARRRRRTAASTSGGRRAGTRDRSGPPRRPRRARAEPEGQRQPGRARPDRLTRVDRRGQEVGVEGGHRSTGRELDRRRGPGPQQLGHVLAPVGHQVEGGHVEVVLGRRGDPRLVGAVEGHHVASRDPALGRPAAAAASIEVPATPMARPKPPAPARKARRSSRAGPSDASPLMRPPGGRARPAPASRRPPRHRPLLPAAAARRRRPCPWLGNPDGVRRPASCCSTSASRADTVAANAASRWRNGPPIDDRTAWLPSTTPCDSTSPS